MLMIDTVAVGPPRPERLVSGRQLSVASDQQWVAQAGDMLRIVAFGLNLAAQMGQALKVGLITPRRDQLEREIGDFEQASLQKGDDI